MTFDDKLPELIKPSLQTIGYEHEWASSLFEDVLLFFEYDNLNAVDSQEGVDQLACRKIALDLLKRIPAWKLHWNDCHDALDEVCRQLQLQIRILGRTLLFIAKQIPHECREHAMLADLHTTLITIPPEEFMPERFAINPGLTQWVQYWLEHPLANKVAPSADADVPTTPVLEQGFASLLLEHLPTRNIWLFDQYLSSAEHANLMVLTARVYRATRSPMLQLDAQATIERALCEKHAPNVLDKLVPGTAAWFLHAFDEVPGMRPQDMLAGWYEVYMHSGDGNRVTPMSNPEKYAEYTNDDARWWIFFKDRFAEISCCEGVRPLTRKYANAAVTRMGCLDGSEKKGFWKAFRQSVGGSGKKPPSQARL